jgi:redox-sensing transcriptional repressor
MPERFGRRIPEPTVTRLPLYQRVLSELLRRDVSTVSSAELADACGVNAAKVRKDLSHFGSYGTPGTGYDVHYLLGQVTRELGSDRQRPIVVCGMGNLGHALVGSPGFTTAGFRVVGLFDVEPQRLGEVVAGTSIRHISELESVCALESVTIGVLTTPPQVAQDVSDRLVAAGVTAILNFAPAVVAVPDGIQVRHVDFSAELQVLAFYHDHPETGAPRRNGNGPEHLPAVEPPEGAGTGEEMSARTAGLGA